MLQRSFRAWGRKWLLPSNEGLLGGEGGIPVGVRPPWLQAWPHMAVFASARFPHEWKGGSNQVVPQMPPSALGQAMEIGSAALNILVECWDGHLTPPEVASLADRASRARDSNMVRAAAELALSCLPHAHALNPNEIQRALVQCKEQVSGPEAHRPESFLIDLGKKCSFSWEV